MQKKAKIISIVNQKGGTGKTTTTENLGIGLANEGKKVLLIDMDPQGSLTISLGFPDPDEMDMTIGSVLVKMLQDNLENPKECILQHKEGIEFIPGNIELSGLEVSLVNIMSRETVLKQYLNELKRDYDYILIDCMSSLGMLTMNALVASDSVIIPVQSQYLSAKGLEQLLKTISKVKRQVNPRIKIDGIVLTMVDKRTNYSKEISSLIREVYGSNIKVYSTDIPQSVRAAEISASGKSIYKHDPKGKVAEAYRELTKEVITVDEKKRKHQIDQIR